MSKEEIRISKERKDRYGEKLDKLGDLIEELEQWHTGVEDLLSDKPMRKAVYKSFQEAGEIVSDICAMYLSDNDRVLGDDSDNIDKAAGKLFTEDLREQLLEVNGLRNRVVHDYNGFDDRIALNSIENRVKDLRKFEGEVRKWIENR